MNLIPQNFNAIECLLHLSPVVVNLFFLAELHEYLPLGAARPPRLPAGENLLGVHVNVDPFLLPQEIVKDIGMVPDLAADSERFQRVGDTPANFSYSGWKIIIKDREICSGQPIVKLCDFF